MDNVASKIPDVWYDLYVRLIPGSVFVASVLFVFGAFPSIDSVASAVWILIAGYVFGFLLQPISAFAARRIEEWSGQVEARDKIRAVYPANHRETLVLSKQHAETVGMMGCAMFTALLAIIQEFGVPVTKLGGTTGGFTVENKFDLVFLMVCLLLFLAMAYERAFSARQRARKLKEHPDFVAFKAGQGLQAGAIASTDP